MVIPHLPDNCLRNKVILITGAGSGIGRAVAKAMSTYGATIVLVGKTTSKLESIYDDIEQQGGPTPAIFPMDFTGASEHDVDELINSIEQTFGRLDGVLHNAAHFGALTPFASISSELWYTTMQVNINTPFLITRAALPLLKKSAAASIIFTTDAVGKKSKAYTGAYGVSKFAIEGMAQILAQELESSHVRVNRIEPIEVKTGLTQRIYAGEEIEKLPMPDRITSTYVYLMSDESREIKGASVVAAPQ